MRHWIPGSNGARIFFLAGNLLLSHLSTASGQLAITEVMSSASTNLGTTYLPALSDYWELTNFGDSPIDLTDYRWNDDPGDLAGGDSYPFDGLTIKGGESIIFVQIDVSTVLTNAAQFREWWGTNLPANLKVIPYGGNGLANPGDSVNLWGPAAANDGDVVDRVEIPTASRGRSFTYHPETGEFGYLSVRDVNFAFKAATRDDIGSPGCTTPAIPLQILEQPASLTVCAGLDAIFTVRAGGLPRPRYQWFARGLPISGATSASLWVTNVQPADAGEYHVQVSNGFEATNSIIVSLEVSANSSPPTMATPLADVSVLVGETARFTAQICAYPLPVSFQWLSNNVAIVDATNRALSLKNCTLEMSGTTYCLHVENPLGALDVCARLTVMPRPQLLFTEVMASPSTNGPGRDWLEITNVGTNEFSLLGCRFADDLAQFRHGKAHVIETPAVIQPGQSAILVWRMSRGEFFDWWGVEALPPGLPVVTFIGQSIMAEGEELYLSSPGAVDENDLIASASSASDRLTNGFSQWFASDTLANTDTYSVLGERGAFRAALWGDVGSPGYTTNPPPRMVHVARGGSGVTIRWRALPGKTYQLRCKTDLTEATWTYLSEHPADNFVVTATDATVGNARQRFYRVEEMP